MSPAQTSPDLRVASVAQIGGLYAVTPDEADTSKLADKVGKAIAGGARFVQYRNKSADATLRREQAAALLALCRGAHVPLLINDDLDLAAALGADGVHLGRDDIPVAVARSRLGRSKILGASCYDRLDLAAQARAAGADYVAFGSAFASTTKPDAPRAPLSLFREAKARLGVPIAAIGGITRDNARMVIDAGADAIAVISAVFDTPDVECSAKDLASLFSVHELKKRSAV